MEWTTKRWTILGLVILAGIILGRLVFRAALNLVMGGTLFGGNFL